MHEEIVNIIAYNAFNSASSDYTGNDDFGISVAWIDLQDFLEDPNDLSRSSDDISREAMEYTGGKRYVLVFWDANGNRDVHDGYDSKEEMLRVFTSFRNDFEEWSIDNDNDSTY